MAARWPDHHPDGRAPQPAGILGVPERRWARAESKAHPPGLRHGAPVGGPGWQTWVVHKWTVGGAVIESTVIHPPSLPGDWDGAGGGVLLVQNRRHGGLVDWTPPGGVIDHGESLLEGLTREVEEETGLRVLEWSRPLYEIDAVAPDLGWRLRVVVHRAESVEGTLRTGDDPDGIVTSADLVPVEACEERLRAAHPWVREPLMDWMLVRWVAPRLYRYVAEGTDPFRLEVSRRLEPD